MDEITIADAPYILGRLRKQSGSLPTKAALLIERLLAIREKKQ